MPVQVVVAGVPDRPETRDLLTAAGDPFVQGKTLILIRNEVDRTTLGSRLPFVNSAVEVDGRPLMCASADAAKPRSPIPGRWAIYWPRCGLKAIVGRK